MPKITSKGQITIPQNIRNRFGFIPGMDVEIIIEGNKAFIVKSRDENKFMKWLGRGGKQSKTSTDHRIDQIRGRTDAQLNKADSRFNETDLQIRKNEELLEKTIKKLDEIRRHLWDLGLVQGEAAEDL